MNTQEHVHTWLMYSCHNSFSLLRLAPTMQCICLVYHATRTAYNDAFGASLSEPHTYAKHGDFVYRTFSRHIFAVCPLQFCMIRKWLALASRSNFPFGALPLSIISSETKAAVLPCPLSLMYAAKSGRQATTAVPGSFAAVCQTIDPMVRQVS